MPQADNEGRVDYVEFPSTDLGVTKTFYGETFGWKFTDYGDDYTSFQDGRLAGGFNAGAEVARGGALVVLYSARIEEIHEQVKANGGTIVRPTFDFPGGRRFHFTDPSGNELAVWSDR